MPALNFKEIPPAHVPSGNQDIFELFACEFLQFVGYEIVEHPGRGPDGGKDLIVCESRKGVGGETKIRWLVSCKHKATTQKAVGVGDEPSILERVKSKSCEGFLGFYSTLPSSALVSRICELKKEIEAQWYDRAKIESQLIKSTTGVQLAKRYFSKSISTWQSEHPKPAKLFVKSDNVLCEFCQKDLLKEIRKKGSARSLVTFWKEPASRSIDIDDLHWTCKGNCDFSLAAIWQQKGWGYRGWADLSDYCIPTHFLKTVMVLAKAVS